MKPLEPGHFRIFIDREHQTTSRHKTSLGFWDVPIAVIDGAIYVRGLGRAGRALLPDCVRLFLPKEEK
jgi:hypothetical protein